ncbi:MULTISPECIES: hypothetical protein [Candidatus Cardinium]|uniref:hypothetical protein n=1 Tax=Candidatus Cardinium TaxID=273135 RepID=UPI001FA9680E|nr:MULTISPECIES: hypothetical protein [Cardinium]
MKKANIFYRSVICASAFSTLVGCSYHTKNGMMDNPSGPLVSLTDQPIDHPPGVEGKVDLVYTMYDPKIYKFDDESLQLLLCLNDTLIKRLDSLKQYILENKTDVLNKLAVVDTSFLKLQQPYLTQGSQLIPTPAVDRANMDSDQLIKFKECRAHTPTFHELYYLRCWYDKLIKSFAAVFNDLFICSGSSGLCVEDYVKVENEAVHRAMTSSSTRVKGINCSKKNINKQVKYVQEQIHNQRVIRKYSDDDPGARRNRSIQNAVVTLYAKHLIPYLGRVVDYLIRQALNTSVAQGYINLSDAEKKYKEATQHTAFLWRQEYICHYQDYIKTHRKTGNAYADYQARSIIYDPAKIIQKLMERGLKPIDDRYAQLCSLVNSIVYDVDASLKEALLSSLTILYNTLYSTAIVHIMGDVAIFPVAHNAPKNSELVAAITNKAAAADIIIAKYKTLLAGVILNQEPHVNLANIDSVVKELQHVGLHVHSIESDHTPNQG